MNPLDLIFPKDLYCVSCGRPLPPLKDGGYALCERCASEIMWVTGRRCAKCGRPLADENPGELCRDCASGAEHAYRKGYACAVYSGRAAELVRGMKYRGKAWRADAIASLMAARYFADADPETGELPCYDYILWAPMNAGKKAVRGYDQAELLASGFAKRTGIPCLKNALKRARDTDVMSSLSADERRQNLADAFEVRCDMIGAIEGGRLLLVDDVYTTGSTASACAGTLLAAGAEYIDIFVFATGADARAVGRAV